MHLPDYPGLAVSVLDADLGRPLRDVETPPEILALLALDADAPLQRDEAVRTAVRDLLRLHGYKPTGRGKPASEYLVKAAEGGHLGPINAAVDVCNAVSLHSGLPISVVDLDRTIGPLRIVVGGPGDAYVFNASGQTIDLDGLLCLRDDEAPCANAVRDSQRTKTHADTQRTRSVIWAPASFGDRLAEATAWYERLYAAIGATTSRVETEPAQ